MLKSPRDTGFYRVLHALVPLAFTRLYRMRVTGLEHVPTSGAVVLASNHLSNMDPFFLGVACPRQVHFMAKAEIWKVPLVGRLVEALGSFPVQRGAADRRAVEEALGVLSAGAVLGIFPEGHRSRDGRLGTPQAGVALFSLRKGVATIPVAVIGTDRVVHHKLPGLPRVTVTFGPAIDVEVGEGSKSERQRVVTRRLMRALADLSGQELPRDDTLKGPRAPVERSA
jgi:1-acyl-sn-glycerol-3-phosphate acyltransferase